MKGTTQVRFTRYAHTCPTYCTHYTNTHCLPRHQVPSKSIPVSHSRSIQLPHLDKVQQVPLRVGLCISMNAWLLMDDLLICILGQELSHWLSMFSRENPFTGAGLIRDHPAINQWEQCILGGGVNSCLKMVEVLRPLLAEWASSVRLHFR